MLVDLVNNDEEKHSGLQIYLRNMMAVLSFDVERCGRVISQTELTEYSHLLSSAVTEALLYFIGHQDPPPCSGTRYHAACGAHVAHMLRDMVEDISAGYYNIPSEYISAQQISFDELHSLSIRKWVFSRVMLARRHFKLGRDYISQVKSLRCRLAGFAYLARFEWVLRMIERDGYCLRPEYHERKSLRASLWVAWRTFSLLINMPWIRLEPGPQAPLPDQCEDK
jgi:phytoene/squalene synthetase